MKKSDLLMGVVLVAIIAPFLLSSSLYEFYTTTNGAHPYLMAFTKFAILATIGDMMGLRIKSGAYSEPGFGVVPRAVVYGLLGVWIAAAMKCFAAGAPAMAESFGFEGVAAAMKGSFTAEKLLGAFCISVMMNTIFAPVFMTIHRVTDMHILKCDGSMKTFITPIPFKEYFTSLNWGVLWSFVFKKTIPLFWVPAHTITFLLPPQSQVLFAALLSVALGLILSIASVMSRK